MTTLKHTGKEVRVNEISWNISSPRYANFSIFTAYDIDPSSVPEPNDPVVLTIGGQTMFNGWVLNMRRKASSGGGEELTYEAAGPRHFLQKESFIKEGSLDVVYNESDNILTVGQIFLELAATIPNRYVKGVSTSAALAMTAKPGRFEVSNEPYANILQRLVELAGDYIWYIDVNRVLQIVRQDSLTARNVYMGEIGEALSAHSEYEGISIELQEDITNAYSRCKVISQRSEDEDFDWDFPVYDSDGNDVTDSRVGLRSIRCMPAWNPDDEPEPFHMALGTGNPDMAAAEHFRQLLGRSSKRDVFRKFVVRLPHDVSLVTAPYFMLHRWEYDREDQGLPPPDSEGKIPLSAVLKPWKRSYKAYNISASYEHNQIHNTMVINLDQPEHSIYFSGFTEHKNPTQAELNFDIYLSRSVGQVKNEKDVRLVYKVVPPRLSVKVGTESNRSRLDGSTFVSGTVTDQQAIDSGSLIEVPKLSATIGPEGTAYTRFGLDRMLYVLETNIEDVTELESIAQKALDRVKDVKYNGQLVLKGLVTDIELTNGINIRNANAAWESLKIPIFNITIRPQSDTTTLDLTSDFYPS